MLREVVDWVRVQIKRVPRRYWLCLLAAFNICILNAIRFIEFKVYDMIVTGWGQPEVPYVPGSYSCPYRAQKPQKQYYIKDGQFNWEFYKKKKVRNILRWVHILTHLPFGIWADLYGGQRMLFVVLVASAVVTVATPAAIEADADGDFYVGMFVLRRLCASPVLPAVISLLGQWALPAERTTFVAIISGSWYVGYCLGRAMFLSVARWESLYYWVTALTALCAVLWWFVVKPWEVKKLLEPPDARAIRQMVPLLELAMSPALVGTYLLAFASHGISLMVDSLILYYLQQALLTDVRNEITETFVTLPLEILGLVCPCLASGIVSDLFVRNGLVGLPAARRFHVAFSCAGVAIFTLLLIAVRCNVTLVIACLAGASFFNSVQRSVIWAVPLDAAPRLAGTLFALVHIAGCFGMKAITALVPPFIGSYGMGDLRAWAAVFTTVALVIVTFPVPYLVWGPFKEFKWAKLDPTPASIKSLRKYRIYSVLTLLAISCLIIVGLIFIS